MDFLEQIMSNWQGSSDELQELISNIEVPC